MKKLPKFIRKLYVLCDAEGIEDCEKCPFFELDDSKFICVETIFQLLDVVIEDIKEEYGKNEGGKHKESN